MRLAAKAKAGFYPAHHTAVSLALQHVRPPDGIFNIIDPCAGKGEAIAQIARTLICPLNRVYAVELDEGRAAECKANLAGANVIAPASLMGVRCTAGTMSFAWLNPPFDTEPGGGKRDEYSFLARITSWLKVHGVLAMVMPEKTYRNSDVCRQLGTWFEDITCRPFPEEVREFEEVIVLAMKRSEPFDLGENWGWWKVNELCEQWNQNPLDTEYRIPSHDCQPKTWEKFELTDAELAQSLARSPLQRLLQPPPELPMPSPPLALSDGHITLLLASGQLDKPVCPEGESPHLPRGTAIKEKYLASTEEGETPGGKSFTKQVFRERPALVVRVLTTTGEIKTLKM